MSVLDHFNPETCIQWNSSAGDNAMLAQLEDLVEAMCQQAGQGVQWDDRRSKAFPSPRNSSLPVLRQMLYRLSSEAPLMLISDQNSVTDARGLQERLAVSVKRPVFLNMHDTVDVASSNTVILLLARNTLLTPSCLAAAWRAIRLHKSIVTIVLAGTHTLADR